jgi:hypothetical protein
MFQYMNFIKETDVIQNWTITLDITSYPVWAGANPLDASAELHPAVWNWLFRNCGWGTSDPQETGRANWALMTSNDLQVIAFRSKSNAEHFHSFWRALSDQEWDDHLAEYPVMVEIDGWPLVWDDEEYGLWYDAEEWLDEKLPNQWSFIRCRTRGIFIGFKRPENASRFTMGWHGPDDHQS